MGNGKLMGTRKWHYAYKQKHKLPDQRESVIVTKLRLEYKKAMELMNGDQLDATHSGHQAVAFATRLLVVRYMSRRSATTRGGRGLPELPRRLSVRPQCARVASCTTRRRSCRIICACTHARSYD